LAHPTSNIQHPTSSVAVAYIQNRSEIDSSKAAAPKGWRRSGEMRRSPC